MDLRGCLYGRRDGTFVGTGRFSSRAYMRIFLPGTISLGTICKVSIISSWQSGTECLYDKNCPTLAGIPVERTGIRLAGTGRKTSQQNSFHINGMGQIRDIYMHGEIPFNVPSGQTSRPTSHINSPWMSLRSMYVVKSDLNVNTRIRTEIDLRST